MLVFWIFFINVGINDIQGFVTVFVHIYNKGKIFFGLIRHTKFTSVFRKALAFKKSLQLF